MSETNCDICAMWNIEAVATQVGTWADGRVLRVCNTCYKGGALGATVKTEEIKPMHIGPRVGYVEYENDYGDYIITWRRNIDDREYVFTYAERSDGTVDVRASRKRFGTIHDLTLA